MYGLNKACDLILHEGLENRWKKSHRSAELFRSECRKNGFGIFSKFPVDSLTAFTLPSRDVPTGKLIKVLKDKYGVVIANGQDEFKDKIARVSHMGDLEPEDTKELAELIIKEYNGL
jgi:aspartate aminotransferase-like enzyme